MCNIHEHAVLTDIMVPKGSSFIGKHGDDFMPTNDLAWVGFSVEIGPEGGVYILDWHDTDVCGNAINFPNSGRVYRIMPKGAKPIARPNLRSLADEELVALQNHSNDWYVRQARVLLHTRAAAGKLNASAVHRRLGEMFASAATSPKRLRALWALHVTGGLDETRLTELLEHDDPYVRAWSIQFLCDDSDVDAFYLSAAKDGKTPISKPVLDKFVAMAGGDDSPVVRLYLASAAQRLPFADRWGVLGELVKHEEDIDDNNLPRMVWFGLEPMVPDHAEQALAVAAGGKLPQLQEFVARRMVSGKVSVDLNRPRKMPTASPEFDRTLQPASPPVSRCATSAKAASCTTRCFAIRWPCKRTPKTVRRLASWFAVSRSRSGQQTHLNMRVSHHPHGDWQLRVLVNDDVLVDKIVDAKAVSEEWLDLDVDLSQYAGKQVQVSIENKANNWSNEWAYWNSIKIKSE